MKKLNGNGAGALPVLIVVVILGLTGFVGWQFFEKNSEDTSNNDGAITNFEECAAAGNPIMESYPEQCAANGQTFVKDYKDAD